MLQWVVLQCVAVSGVFVCVSFEDVYGSFVCVLQCFAVCCNRLCCSVLHCLVYVCVALLRVHRAFLCVYRALLYVYIIIF